MPETDFVRVTDDVKPHREFSVPADAVTEGMRVLKDKPARYPDGSVIPPKYTPESLAGKKSGGSAAETPKENS